MERGRCNDGVGRACAGVWERRTKPNASPSEKEQMIAAEHSKVSGNQCGRNGQLCNERCERMK